MRKTITISKKIPKAFIISFLIALFLVFIREHWSEFKYDVKVYNSLNSKSKFENKEKTKKDRVGNLADFFNSDSKEIDIRGIDVTGDTPLQFVRLETPYHSTIYIENEQYYIKDKWSGKFNKYSFKIKYYLQALIKDFKYVIYYWLVISMIWILFQNFKIRFK